MPELGTTSLGTTELGTPSSQTTATVTATGTIATASGGGATATTTGTLHGTGTIATASPGGAAVSFPSQARGELGIGELGTGMIGVAGKTEVDTLTTTGTTATARGRQATLQTTTTVYGTGTTAAVETPSALLDTISGGILGTGELGGGMLGVSTGESGVVFFADGATAEASGGGGAKLIDLDLPPVAAPSRGWHVEIDHPSGRTRKPQLLDDPQFTPQLNDYPRVEIPVPRDETWQQDAFEGATLRVWQDGKILPIDSLVDVRVQPDRTVLIGRGGSELRERVQAEYDNEEVHVAATELVESETSYVMHADDPGEPFASGELLQSAQTESELRDQLNQPLRETDPVEIADGELQLQQTCFVSEAEAPDTEQDPAYWQDQPESSGGAALGIYLSSSMLEWTFTPQYRIPADAVGLKARDMTTDDAQEMEIQLVIDGATYVLDELSGGEGIIGPSWREFAQEPGYNGPGYEGPDIPAGSEVTVRITSTGSAGGRYGWDILALYDARYEYSWPEDNGGDGGYLAGPELYPDAHDVVFADATTAFNVTGGEVSAVLDDTSGKQAVALSNDQGATYSSAANTTSLASTFDDPGASLRWKVTLSRYGSQSGETPTQGVTGQTMESFELRGDLEDTPVLVDQKYDGSLKSVLNGKADYANAVWEVRRQSLDEWSIEWTHPGLRESESDADIANYRVSKSVASQYEEAVIKGAAQPIRGEQFTAVPGEWAGLAHANVVSATQIVRDPESGDTFERGVDYELDRSGGRIKALADGAMMADTVYELDYEFKTQGSYMAEDASADPDTVVRTISSITSNRGCTQAALYLIREVKEPLWEAEVTVPTADAGLSLVDDINIEDLPTQGERMEVQEIRQTPQEVVLRLGSRQSVGEVINDLQSRISSVSERV